MEEVLPKVPQLKQHNILVRSYLHLGSIEARIFTLMLKDSQLNNNEFKKNIEIKVNDIIGENPSGKAYQLLKNACDDLLSKKLDLLKLGVNKKKASKNDYHKVGIVQELELDSGSGFVRGLFTDRVQSYLEQLKRDYTLTALEHLMTLKSGYSHRMYWLMNSYKSLGEVTIPVEELKKMVCGDKDEYDNPIDKYPRYYDFRKNVIEKSLNDIKDMIDVEWTENVPKGKKVVSLTFKFPHELKAKSSGKLVSGRQGSLFAPAAVGTASIIDLNSYTPEQKKLFIRLTKHHVTPEQADKVIKLTQLTFDEIHKKIITPNIPERRKLNGLKEHNNLGAELWQLLKSTLRTE